MAFVQRRKGPDVVGSFGLLQPLADGLKLILKEPISPSSANFSLFRMAPVATFMLSLVARAVVPFDYGMVLSDSNIGLLYLFAISSLGVYGIITAGVERSTLHREGPLLRERGLFLEKGGVRGEGRMERGWGRSGKPSLYDDGGNLDPLFFPLPPGSGSGKGQRKDLTSKQSLEFSLIRTGLARK
ncbi:hypothetical protein JHK85_002858 [Glycine max]|nr:hypothetical protein JHK85_002858 [Glycine max]